MSLQAIVFKHISQVVHIPIDIGAKAMYGLHVNITTKVPAVLISKELTEKKNAGKSSCNYSVAARKIILWMIMGFMDDKDNRALTIPNHDFFPGDNGRCISHSWFDKPRGFNHRK